MKKFNIFITTLFMLFVLAFIVILPVGAEETNYFEISFGENGEIRETLFFVDCGIDEQNKLWTDVTAWYDSDMYDKHPSVFFIADNNLVCVLYEWNDTANNYLRQFHLRDVYGELVTLDEQVIPGMHYRMEYFTFNGEECDHEMIRKDSDVDAIDYCRYCGYEVFDHTHDYVVGETITEPTCTTEGSYYDVCCVVGCGEKNVGIIPKLGHNLVVTTNTSATCTEDGVYEEKCKNCNYITKSITSSLGHDFCKLTCTQSKTCKTCGFVEKEALGHQYISFNVFGWTICSNCNELCKVDANDSDNSPSGTNNSFNDEFKEFVNNTESLLSLVMGFCVFVLVFLLIKKIINRK